MAYERILTRIDIIENKLNDLEEWLPLTVEEYLKDKKGQAAIERSLQIIIQAIMDIAIQLLKYFKLEPPQSELDMVDLLQPYLKHINVIKELKKFRNFLVHIYGRIDSRKVHDHALQMKSEIPKLIEEIQQVLKSTKNGNSL
ncbi:MAG: DUF86 domain-containing protein [Promethearchaeota archaeon]|nr:MAG: DUF86 domain-containing protein [Candidatus Lokiarchaeota archaeon]